MTVSSVWTDRLYRSCNRHRRSDCLSCQTHWQLYSFSVFFVSVMIYVSYGLIPELFFLFELYTEHTSYIYMLLLLLSGEILFLSNDKQEIIADSYLYLCVHWILSDSVECLYVQMLLFSIWRTTQLVISLCITWQWSMHQA